MTELEAFFSASRQFGMLLDANILTLLVVGRVNRARIATFKRTQRYDESAFDLLLDILQKVSPAKLFAIPHVFKLRSYAAAKRVVMPGVWLSGSTGTQRSNAGQRQAIRDNVS